MTAISLPRGSARQEGNEKPGNFKLFVISFLILACLFFGIKYLFSTTLVAGSSRIYLATEYQKVNPTNFNLPDFPKGPCRIFQILTGKPCRWEMEVGKTDKGNIAFRLNLMSGKYRLIEIEGMRCLLKELESGLPTSFQGNDWGWVSYVEVADWTRGLGLGRIGWIAFDRVAKIISSGIGEEAIHVFADASEMNWGTTLLQGIPVISQISDRLWIYLVPEH